MGLKKVQSRIKGIAVQLAVRTQTGIDGFNRPVYEDTWETVDNVLVGSPAADEVTDKFNLSGKRIDYILAVPKGDLHKWYDTRVRLPDPFGGIFETVGMPAAGIDENIPLAWNMKVKVRRYEQDDDRTEF